MIKRAVWIAALAALLAAGGTVLFLLNAVFLQDSPSPDPLPEDAGKTARQNHLNLTDLPLSWTSPSKELWSAGALPAPLAEHPETHFRWKEGTPGVAHVTLSEGLGWTRLPALAAEDGTLIEWTGVLPSSASFEFRTGLFGPGSQFHFAVDIREGSGPPHLLFSETAHAPSLRSSPRWFDPIRKIFQVLVRGREHRDDLWHPGRVDLSAWSGRPVRISLRVEAEPAPLTPSSGIAFWGAPRIWFPAAEVPRVKRRGASSVPGTSVVLAVLETTPSDGGGRVPPRAESFLRESVSFPRFYACDVRTSEAFRRLLFSPDALLSTATLSAWPRTAGANGYRTLAVGAFSNEMMGTLAEAGFDEIYQIPHDGYDSSLVASAAVDWARERGRGPVLILAFFRDLPRFRWAPARFWASSLHAVPWSRARLVFWKRATDSAYLDDSLGRVGEIDGPAPPLVAVVSLRGSVADPTPVRWPRTGRRGSLFLNERGWGLRESEIRTLFALRQGDRWPQGLCRSLGQLSDVGPTLLTAVGLPVPAGGAPVWNLGAVSLSEESNGRRVVRSSRAKALILDGRYKYIRHLPPDGRSEKIGTSERIDFPTEEIFDLWTDPGERRNLARSRRHLLARLREVLSEVDPDPVDVRLEFINPAGAQVEGRITCSAGGISDVWGTLPIARGGSYTFSFSTSAPAGSVTFRTWPPHSSYSMRFAVDRRSLPAGQFRVSRFGLPLFESMKNEWIDKTEFGWMDGWTPLMPSSAPVVSLGRVLVLSEGAGRPEGAP